MTARRDQVRRVLWALRVRLKMVVLDGLLRPVRPPQMVRLGTYYGGWWVPAADLPPGAALCVGAGTDVSLEVELQRLGHRVYAVDPTPRAVEFVRQHHPDLPLLPVGVWTEEGHLSFRRDETWPDSWSVEDESVVGTSAGSAGDVETFEVTTVRGLMERIGEPELTLLKLDIEGAEHAVVRQLLDDGLRPASLGVEFDDHRARQVLATTRLLRRHGYDLWQLEGLNALFVRR